MVGKSLIVGRLFDQHGICLRIDKQRKLRRGQRERAMQQRPSQAGVQYPQVSEGGRPSRPVRRTISWFAALTAFCCMPSPVVFAGDVPTASANAELVAFAGALEYAQRPQVLRHGRHSGEASLRSKSLTYIARKFAHLMIRDVRRSMREESGEQRSPTTRPRIKSNYDLRVSDDKLVVRMKFRF